MSLDAFYAAHLTRALNSRMGDAAKGKELEDIISDIYWKNAHSKEYEYSFPKMHKVSQTRGHIYKDVNDRRLQISALYPLIGKFIGSFFKASEVIIELGSGLPDSKGKTCLTRILPEKYEVVSSDLNQDIVDDAKRLLPSYRRVDACHLNKLDERQFVACNLIDTFTEEAFNLFLDNLPTGSTFVHFNDMTPFINWFCWEITKSNEIVVPYIEEQKFVGAIKVKDYKSLRTQLANALDVMEINFLDAYAQYNHEQREGAFITSLRQYSDALSIWIQKVIPKTHLEFINIVECYQKRLQSFKRMDIEILCCQTVKFSDIVDRSLTRESYNWIHFDGINGISGKIYVLAPGKELITAHISFFAIQKNH